MKKLLSILLIVCLLTGCKDEENQEDVITTFTRETTCELNNYTVENDPNGISSYSFTMHIYYNTLDDDETYLENYATLNFNSWNEAKIYYDENKEKYKDLDMTLSEEDIDTDNTGTVSSLTMGIEENTPRIIIEEQKNQGFECNTRKVEKEFYTG